MLATDQKGITTMSLFRRAKIVRSVVIAAGLIGLALIIGKDAAAQSYGRVWSVFGQGGNVEVTDCSNCGSNVGILISCAGPGRPATVSVPVVSTDRVPPGVRQPITFFIKGRAYTYMADTRGSPKVGTVPTFALRPDDPLIRALQAGFDAVIDFAGISIRVPLNGSGRALDVFQSRCTWRQAAQSAPSAPPKPVSTPTSAATAEPSPRPTPADQDTEAGPKPFQPPVSDEAPVADSQDNTTPTPTPTPTPTITHQQQLQTIPRPHLRKKTKGIKKRRRTVKQNCQPSPLHRTLTSDRSRSPSSAVRPRLRTMTGKTKNRWQALTRRLRRQTDHGALSVSRSITALT